MQVRVINFYYFRLVYTKRYKILVILLSFFSVLYISKYSLDNSK
jgi:hypothetical protein